MNLTLAKTLGGIGRTLIGSGVIILMFVVYQLWGTGLQEGAAQDELESEFAASLQVVGATTGDEASSSGDDDQPAADEGVADLLADIKSGQADSLFAVLQETTTTTAPPTTTTAPPTTAASDGSATDGSTTTPAPTTTTTAAPTTTTEPLPPPEPEEVRKVMEILYPAEGKPLALIEIPKLDVEKLVIEGVQVEDLKRGPGHYPDTPLPGTPGNSSIAGHRTTYGAPFHNIDKLVVGDDIFVETVLGRAHYKVIDGALPNSTRIPGSASYIVTPNQVEVLNDYGDNRLTLTACHPKYSARQRIIINAVLQGEPIVVPENPAKKVEIERVTYVDPTTTTTAAPTTTTTAPPTTTTEPPTTADSTTDSELAGEPTTTAVETTTTTTALPDEGGPDGDGLGDDPVMGSGNDETPNESIVSAVDTSGSATDTLIQNPDQALQGDLDQGLAGDPDALRPALLWAIGAGLVFGLAWFAGRQWSQGLPNKTVRKLTAYVVASPAFLILLYNSFYHVDRLLPAY